MTYQETIQYLESFINYEKFTNYPYKESIKLERVKEFLSEIGNPQEGLNYIHIAGSKGKGSTCAFIAYILREAGYKVGLYTSPHLSDFRERIRILKPINKEEQFLNADIRKSNADTRRLNLRPSVCNSRESALINSSLIDFEGMISEEELTQAVERLKPAIEEYNKNSKYGPLSFFEVYTALAFVYFREKKVDFAVLETGLGGRLDATNVVSPLVCAITPISFDHTDKLGNTLTEIATEKAGIIKAQSSRYKAQNLIVISAPQAKEVEEIIRKRCAETDARLYEIGRDIFFEEVNPAPARRGWVTGQVFNLLGIFSEYPHLQIGLLGRHQIINAATAVGVVEALRFYGILINTDAIRQGLRTTIWPGRLEIICTQPLIILDSAHNAASSRALKDTIRNNFSVRKIVLVLGISQDKDIKGICNELKDIAEEIILTKADNPRAAEPRDIKNQSFDKLRMTLKQSRMGQIFPNEVIQGSITSGSRSFSKEVAAFGTKIKDKKISLSNSVKEALELAKSQVRKEDLILVTGSLFVVAEARSLILAQDSKRKTQNQ